MSTPFQEHSQFYKPLASDQSPEQIVDISTWAIGGAFNPYAEGTRAKYEVTCPLTKSDKPFLIAGHRYLYKKTFERRNRSTGEAIVFYDQFWVEIAAYHVGRALGVEVPPAFVATRVDLNRQSDIEHAALIEWYYNYPNHVNCHVDRGGDLMSRLIEGYDRDKGRQHNFCTIRDFFEQVGLNGWKETWVRMLTFDAIIGNTDRHQENWELLSYPCGGGIEFTLSPAFDNGTAMGYEVIGKDIHRYIEKGTHHMKWQKDDDKPLGHFVMLERLLQTLPNARKTIEDVLSHNMEPAYNAIGGFTRYGLQNGRYALSEARAAWMIALLKARIERIKTLVQT